MNMFRYGSPMLDFIGKVSDMIVLNLLWVVCSIPIITIGAATSAKYSIAMRIIRQEETPVIKPFFKAFADNFKQATVIWVILMAVIAVCMTDWFWIYQKGFGNVSVYYVIAIAVLSMFVLGVCMTVFAFIARFTVTTKEAIKAAVVFSFLHFIKLFLIVALEFGTIIASIWYARWLIAVALFGTTSAFYFNCILLVKEFKKMEDNLAQNNNAAEEKDETNV